MKVVRDENTNAQRRGSKEKEIKGKCGTKKKKNCWSLKIKKGKRKRDRQGNIKTEDKQRKKKSQTGNINVEKNDVGDRGGHMAKINNKQINK